MVNSGCCFVVDEMGCANRPVLSWIVYKWDNNPGLRCLSTTLGLLVTEFFPCKSGWTQPAHPLVAVQPNEARGSLLS